MLLTLLEPPGTTRNLTLYTDSDATGEIDEYSEEEETPDCIDWIANEVQPIEPNVKNNMCFSLTTLKFNSVSMPFVLLTIWIPRIFRIVGKKNLPNGQLGMMQAYLFSKSLKLTST
jgi:hypothetical protein